MSLFFARTLGKKSFFVASGPVAETSPADKTTDKTTEKSTTSAFWVVFSGQTDLPWLHMLRRGYRHCFVLMQQRGQWLIFDPLASHTDITLTDMPGGFDLPRWYVRQGMAVWRVNVPPPAPKSQHWRLFSCVEAVKRLLGLRAPWVFTPWQLMRYLRRHCDAHRILPRRADLSATIL